MEYIINPEGNGGSPCPSECRAEGSCATYTVPVKCGLAYCLTYMCTEA